MRSAGASSSPDASSLVGKPVSDTGRCAPRLDQSVLLQCLELRPERVAGHPGRACEGVEIRPGSQAGTHPKKQRAPLPFFLEDAAGGVLPAPNRVRGHVHLRETWSLRPPAGPSFGVRSCRLFTPAGRTALTRVCSKASGPNAPRPSTTAETIPNPAHPSPGGWTTNATTNPYATRSAAIAAKIAPAALGGCLLREALGK